MNSPTNNPSVLGLGLGFDASPVQIYQEKTYNIDLKNQTDKPTSKLKMLWSGINHVISVLFCASRPLASAIHYGVNKGALLSSFGMNNTPECKKRRNGHIESFRTDGLNAALEIERFKANITSEFHGVRLDGLIIPNGESKEYLVVFQPNGVHYEDTLLEAQKLGKELSKNIVLFNYRGVGESTGNPTCAQDLVQDGKAVCKMLIDKKGVTPEKITLYGHSIGGGVATAVAAKNESYNLIIDRSFSSLSKAASDIVTNNTNRVFGFIAKTLFSYYGWNINTAKILKRINNKVLVLTAKGDDVLVKSRLANSLPNKDNIKHFDELKFENFNVNNRRFLGDTQKMTECVNTLSEMIKNDRDELDIDPDKDDKPAIPEENDKPAIDVFEHEANVFNQADTITQNLLYAIQAGEKVKTILLLIDELKSLIENNQHCFVIPDNLLEPIEEIRTELNTYLAAIRTEPNRHLHMTHLASDKEMRKLFAEKVTETFS